jgi:hypothetical protein
MTLITRPNESRTAGTALAYITIGAILTVRAGTSYFFFTTPFEQNQFLGYLRTAVLLLGLVLLVIGFAVGQIARGARVAEASGDAEVIRASTQAANTPAQPQAPVARVDVK